MLSFSSQDTEDCLPQFLRAACSIGIKLKGKIHALVHALGSQGQRAPYLACLEVSGERISPELQWVPLSVPPACLRLCPLSSLQLPAGPSPAPLLLEASGERAPKRGGVVRVTWERTGEGNYPISILSPYSFLGLLTEDSQWKRDRRGESPGVFHQKACPQVLTQ